MCVRIAASEIAYCVEGTTFGLKPLAFTYPLPWPHVIHQMHTSESAQVLSSAYLSPTVL